MAHNRSCFLLEIYYFFIKNFCKPGNNIKMFENKCNLFEETELFPTSYIPKIKYIILKFPLYVINLAHTVRIAVDIFTTLYYQN